MYQHLFAQVGLKTLTLDLDSTVLTRYGFHQGALRGYNPRKRGCASHHPLMSFVADTRMLANVWLRPGNAHTANNAIGFLQSSIQNLGTDKRGGLVRADSGFCENDFLAHLENVRLRYVVALQMVQPLQLFRTALQRQLNKGASVQTLSTLRQQLLAEAGFITKTRMHKTLKLATARQRREWITGLWNAANNFELPWPIKPIFNPEPSG